MMLHQFTKTILLIVAALFPVINPPAAGLMVFSVVPDATSEDRKELARRIAFNSFAMLAVSLSVGAYVLSFFGISMPVLRVAGGIVIGMAGWNLLNTHHVTPDAQAGPTPRESLRTKAFYPLTLPFTVGPGSIAVAIALGTGSPREGLAPVHFLGVVAALAILAASVYASVRFSPVIEALLGKTGTQAAMRLFAFVLFCIGVQIFWLGLEELLTSLRFG
ncbi:MarC family protein [Burkholderia latens]|uniref:MarC family protein n=1 Tax=Burkholderia latens TaxID=488446 RepID=UPI001FC8B075|nr:MarC family protein [Burkholderia latens]